MIGQVVSHYRITAELGSGGMGVVYEARDTKLDRTVALKFLPPESTRDPETKARFQQEARAASALDHPNICAIHEIDETADGRPFIAMARYQGRTLKARLAEGPLPLAEALEIARQLAAGLAEAHRHEIVHRDIKPANIFLTDDGLVKILDFGLAKQTDQTALTMTGTTLGTVAYMSPEQARGEQAGQASDIWSAGVTIYEMLAGKVPFPGAFHQAVVYSILNEEPESLESAVPASLADTVTKCLDKDTARRFADGGELLAGLRQVAKPEPKAGGPRRTRMLLLAGVAVVLVATAFVVWQRQADSPRTPEVPRLAVGRFQQHGNEADEAATVGVMALLNVGLCESSEYNVVSPEYLQDIRRRKGGDGGTAASGEYLQLAREADATYLLTGELVVGDDGALATWRVVETKEGRIVKAGSAEAEHITHLSSELARAVTQAMLILAGKEPGSAPDAPEVEVTADPEAFRYYSAALVAEESGRSDEVRRHLLRAVEADSTFALAHFELSRQYDPQFENELARDSARRAWRYRERLGRKDRLLLQAHQLHLDFKMDQVVAAYDEILANWPDNEEAHKRRAYAKSFSWCAQEAYEDAQEGLDFFPDHPDLLEIVLSAAMCLGKWDEAAALVEAKRGILESRSSGLSYLGDFNFMLKRHAEARRYYDAALEMDPASNWYIRNRSMCAFGRGDIDEAIAVLKRFLERPESTPGDHEALTQSTLFFSIWSFEADAGRPYGIGNDLEQDGPTLLYAGLAEAAVSGLSDGRVDEQPIIDTTMIALLRLSLEVRSYSAAGQVAKAEELLRKYANIRTSRPDLACSFYQMELLLDVAVALARGDYHRGLQGVHLVHEEGYPCATTYEIEVWELESAAQAGAGQLDAAIATLEHLVGIYRGRTLAHYKLGLLYKEAGRTEDARGAFETALDLWRGADPEYPYPRLARAELAALGR